MRARTKVTEERGFTIIEVLAATLMLLAAAAAALTIITAGEHSSETGQRQTALLSVAQQQIEQIRQVVKQSGFDALAIALDQEDWTETVGTIAGDDTIFVATPDASTALTLRQKLLVLLRG